MTVTGWPRGTLCMGWFSLACLTAGCGYGVDGSTPASADALMAPLIAQQPASQSIPMGLSATYSVNAIGTLPQYQWIKNGVAIVGATSSTYVTPATSFADGGARFSVIVSNAVGRVASNAATLAVTARAPAAGDLRFQQVDAASTVDGYGASGAVAAATLASLGAESFTQSLGTPFYTGVSGDCGAGAGAATCTWTYAVTPLSDSLSGLGLAAGYGSDAYANLQYDLADVNWPNVGNAASPATANSVVTSLDLEPASQVFAVSWIQAPASSSTFDRAQHRVALADLETAALREGAAGRVITAVAADGGSITYLSYGWSADATTIYETQVSSAAADAAAAAAAALAARGYLITAIGPADAGGDVVLVGTRVQGDTMARPFVTAQSAADVASMRSNGYATVGVIVAGGADTYLGER